MPNNYIIVMDKTGAHLEHRSHKYTKREWQGKGWRYWYGDQYKKDAKYYKATSSGWSDHAKMLNKVASAYDSNSLYAKSARAGAYNANKNAADMARTAYNSQKLYEKSLAGRIEKGKKIIDSLFKKLKKNVNETAIKTAKKLGLKTDKVETRRDISTGQTYRRVNGGPWEKVK